MTRDRGNRAPAWVAAYLRRWWPSAEKTPNSRPGRDLLGTPGVAWEIKTGTEWRSAWLRQCERNGSEDDLPVLLYLPPGLGERSVDLAMCVIPLHAMMPVLVAAGYAPAPFRQRATGG